MNFSCNASSNFIFNRNEKPVKYKVFNTIDDILPILRECQKNKDATLPKRDVVKKLPLQLCVLGNPIYNCHYPPIKD